MLACSLLANGLRVAKSLPANGLALAAAAATALPATSRPAKKLLVTCTCKAGNGKGELFHGSTLQGVYGDLLQGFMITL